ncbi:hypothetical protein E2562_009008 [Oryza meyeriana var. granulata]|uniref:Uncharacterized protein n=1 Tax=Oryza meyeriana var. granulata TaxID=110450 RepID=A0A6G1D0Z7_9ORYZ|nr:hypothetical protein E2562_009008 [Oryza meyeriana var. granulata]
MGDNANKEECHLEGETKEGDADDRKKGQLPDAKKAEDCPEGQELNAVASPSDNAAHRLAIAAYIRQAEIYGLVVHGRFSGDEQALAVAAISRRQRSIGQSMQRFQAKALTTSHRSDQSKATA